VPPRRPSVMNKHRGAELSKTKQRVPPERTTRLITGLADRNRVGCVTSRRLHRSQALTWIFLVGASDLWAGDRLYRHRDQADARRSQLLKSRLRQVDDAALPDQRARWTPIRDGHGDAASGVLESDTNSSPQGVVP
jgi:hypothetical protein